MKKKRKAWILIGCFLLVVSYLSGQGKCLAETRNDELIQLRISDEKMYFYTGNDTPTIQFSVCKGMYLFVFHRDTEGKILMLWPDVYHDPGLDNFIQTGEIKNIASDYTFSGEHSGTEQIMALGYYANGAGLVKMKERLANHALTGEYLGQSVLDEFPPSDAQNVVSFYYNVNPEYLTESKKVFVIAIGINEYRDSAIKRLKTPVNDANAIIEKIEECYSDRLTVKSKLLTNEKADVKSLRTFLSEGIYDFIDKDTTVYIYFSGHGIQIPDENGDESDHFDEALVPYDFSYYDIYNTLLIDDELYEFYRQIGKQSERLFVIVDACYSAGSVKGVKAILYDTSLKASEQANRDAMESEVEKIDENFIFLSAAGGNEQAMEDPEENIPNSIFTYYFLRAFSEEADYDNNHYVTPEEILVYIKNEMSKWFISRDFPVQTPVLINPMNIEFLIPINY